MASPVDVPNPFLVVFGCLKGALGPSKTWIPYSTSIKIQVFEVSTCKTPLGRLLEALWSTWERLRSLSWGPCGGPLANLTGVPASKIQFFVVLRGVPMISCLRRPSRDAFRWYLEALLAVQRCFLSLLFVFRSWIFQKSFRSRLW